MIRAIWRAVVLAACLPADVVTSFLFLCLAAVFGTDRTFAGGDVLVWVPRGDSWVARRWPYSTTVSHWVLLHPSHDTQTLIHEFVHVRQFEVVCVAWCAVTLLTQSLALLCLWPLAWPIVYLSASLWPLLTGGHWYRDNPFERHARAESGT